jgi:hypothetical protein
LKTAQYTLNPSSGFCRTGDIQQLRGLENGSPLGILSPGANVVYPAQRQASVCIQQVACFTRLLQSLLDFHKDGRRFQSLYQGPACGEGNMLRQSSQDLRELERTEVFGIHYGLTVKISGGNPFGIHGRSVAIAMGSSL